MHADGEERKTEMRIDAVGSVGAAIEQMSESPDERGSSRRKQSAPKSANLINILLKILSNKYEWHLLLSSRVSV